MKPDKITIGIDIGSVATKGLLLSGKKDYQVVMPTGWSPRDAGEKAIAELLERSGLSRSQIDHLVVTGYGRVAFNQADNMITEISCHARGVATLHPEVRTIIDIGGQDSKVININQKGKVVNFAMNDKCAAGTGRFLQVMSTTLGMDISELGDAEDSHDSVSISSMCTVFAESEVIGMLANGVTKERIVSGLHQAVGKRVASMVNRLGIKEVIAFTGGVAMNSGVQRALREELGHPLIVPAHCQFTGALGAAILAFERQ